MRKQRDRREYLKKWREANKEHVIAYSKSRIEKVKAHTVKYKLRHPERTRLQRRKYNRKRADTPIGRILNKHRCKLNYIIRFSKYPDRYVPSIGCTEKEFKQYIEAQFKPGMNWGNYGKFWNLDHIKPTSAFNVLDAQEQRYCFHYTNIQPILFLENILKGNRILSPLQMKIAI